MYKIIDNDGAGMLESGNYHSYKQALNAIKDFISCDIENPDEEDCLVLANFEIVKVTN